MKSSPLGRYSAIVGALVSLLVICAAIASHLLGRADAFLDGMAYTAFGIVMGAGYALTQLNGTVTRTAEQDSAIAGLQAREAARDAALAAMLERLPPNMPAVVAAVVPAPPAPPA